MREPRPRQHHYWITTRDPESGRPYLIYGGLTEDVARQKGLEMLGGMDFEIRRLPTSDLSTASSMVRGKRLASGMGLQESVRRQGHEKTVRRRFGR